jgi:hypothetical protein
LKSEPKIEVDCDYVTETDKAILVVSHDTGKRAWVPFSQCEFVRKGDEVRLTLDESLAIDKELI